MTADPADPLQALRAALARPLRPSSDYDLNPGTVLPPSRGLRAAGVLVAFQPGRVGPELVLTKRSSRLKHHPGQIAFPGGKVEPVDDGPVGAALREASEEVGLPVASVQVLGVLPPHETVTGFVCTPVVARIAGPFQPVPEAGEVEEVFAVPLSHIARLSNYRIERRRWRGTWRSYWAVPYGPHYIWGATARMLRALAEAMADAGHADHG